MLLRDRVYSRGTPRTLRGARAPRVSRAVSGRVRAVSGGVRGPRGPGDASDDEEPDRFGFYDNDMNVKRTREVVRALNGAYRINSSPMTGQMLRDLLVDKWGAVYPVQICLGEEWQVYLQVEPPSLSEADAKNKSIADVLEGIGALLTEWGVADAAWRAIAKHPAKRVGAAGLLIPLPVHYYPGRGAKSVAGSRDDGDTNGSVGDDRGPVRDLMPPSDSWSVLDQQESESSGDPPAP